MSLCAGRDGHSRRVLGHVVADHIGSDMVEQAIDAAVASRTRQGRVWPARFYTPTEAGSSPDP